MIPMLRVKFTAVNPVLKKKRDLNSMMEPFTLKLEKEEKTKPQMDNLSKSEE